MDSTICDGSMAVMVVVAFHNIIIEGTKWIQTKNGSGPKDSVWETMHGGESMGDTTWVTCR